ncbi:hypothetical protein MTO96_016211 [Rhipicephalus appendiculatus]
MDTGVQANSRTPSLRNKVGWLFRKHKWKKIQLQPFEKNLYEELPATASRSMTEVEAYRNANGVSVKGRNVPKRIVALEESNFPDFVVEGIEARRDYTVPLPVLVWTLPHPKRRHQRANNVATAQRCIHRSIGSMNGANGVNGFSGMPDMVGVNIYWDFMPMEAADLWEQINHYEYYLPRGDNMYSFNTIWLRTFGVPPPVPKSQRLPALTAPEYQSQSIEKLFHQEHFATSRRTPSEINEFRKANNVTIRGRAVPTPILRLYEANFPERVAEAAYALNYGPLTALQSQCWPVALRARDLLAIVHSRVAANEQAYLLPAIVRAMRQPLPSNGKGPVVLVLVPTREVAEKIERLVSDFEKCSDVRSVCLCSGDWKDRQLKRLKKASYGIWIATPSRLLPFLEEGMVNVSSCTLLVLDQADRMLAMGLEKMLRSVTAFVRPDRQTLILANSESREIRDLADCLLNDYIQVSIGHSKQVENRLVKQTVIVCEDAQKLDRLVTLLEDILREKQDKVIVFVETRSVVDEAVLELQLRDWCAIGIHGSKTRGDRQRALHAFKSGSCCILVVTDVAAQQLEVDRVRFVVHYDRPANADVYMNRVNYALQCDGSGMAYAFWLPTTRVMRKSSSPTLKTPTRRFTLGFSKSPRGHRVVIDAEVYACPTELPLPSQPCALRESLLAKLTKFPLLQRPNRILLRWPE